MILGVPLGRGPFPPTMKESLWTSSKGLRPEFYFDGDDAYPEHVLLQFLHYA